MKTTKYETIEVTPPKCTAYQYTNAKHSIEHGVHRIETNDNTILFFSLESTVQCIDEIHDAPEPDITHIYNNIPDNELDVDELIDAGNELYRLVIETRDSIRDSGITQGLNEFPDTPDGKKSEEWFLEYHNAASAWKEQTQ